MKKVLFLLTISTMSLSGYAQETNASDSMYYGKPASTTEDAKPSRLDFNAGIETSHLSKGNVVYDGITATGNIHYAFDKKERFTIGFWGGASFDAKSYHEIDYYLQYKTDHFIVGIWDIFNSSGMGDGNAEFPVVSIFDYDKNTSTHLIEFNIVYILPKVFPLRIDIKSELYGRDKDKDVLRYGNGTGSNHNENRYSTYAELSYPIISHQKVNLNLFLGGAFALNGKAKTFLFNEIPNSETKFGITNVGVKTTKNISIFDYKLPVSATAMWDPQNKYTRVQLDVSFF